MLTNELYMTLVLILGVTTLLRAAKLKKGSPRFLIKKYKIEVLTNIFHLKGCKTFWSVEPWYMVQLYGPVKNMLNWSKRANFKSNFSIRGPK
jgi:hypothetical protein